MRASRRGGPVRIRAASAGGLAGRAGIERLRVGHPEVGDLTPAGPPGLPPAGAAPDAPRP